MGIIDDIRRRAANSLSAWANGSNEDISADEMIKSLQQRGLAEPTEEKPKAMFFDPYAINDWGGWRQRPSVLTYEALRHMSMTCAPLAAIIQLRTNQMAQFARPQQGKYDKGYRVILRDRRDRNRSMTPVERKRAMEIERMLETTGVLQTGERARDRDSFRTFMKKGLRDTLTYDQFAFEKLSDREGRVSRFIALPSETIRPAVLDVEHADLAEMRSRVSYVQVYENTVIAEFAYDDLAWCIMNPRSDLRTNGFGFSPIEQIIRLVTAWLFGFSYNQNFFSQGSAVKGLLNIKGTIPDKQMRAFRRQWYSMVSGVENCLSAETPIWTSEGAFEIGSFLGDAKERETRLWTGTEWKPALVYRTQAKQPMRTVLGNGSALITSADHRFRVLNAEGLPDWRRQEDLRVGDFVFVNKQVLPQQAAVPSFCGKQATPELFEVLGWMVGDGYFAYGGRGHAKTNTAQWFYSADTEVLIRDRHFAVLREFAESVVRKDLVLTEAEAAFICEQHGFESVCTLQISLQVCSVNFCEELLRLGFTVSKKAEGGKTIPPMLHVLPAEYRVAFVRGLFSADGNNAKLRSPKFTITNDRLRAQTRLLLASLGIRTSLSEGKSKVVIAGRFRGRVQKPSYLEIKDRDAFFALIQPLQAHKQPRPLAKPNEANKHSRVASTTVLHFLRQVREANAASGYALLTRRERMDLNSILIGQDGCSLPRLLRFLDKAQVLPPEWLTQHHFEPVVSVEQVDSDPIQMFDVQIYDDLHAFAANGVITHNSWRTPILNSEDLQWISMHSNNREMEFSAWMDWVTKLICAVFGVDPLEINFQFGNTGQSSSLNTGDQESKLAESKDKGLRPLSDHFTDVINSHLIWDLAPDFEFIFGGMFGSGEEADREALSKDGSTYKTVNEIRAQEDMAALPGEQGKAILNSTWIQWALQKDAAAQQAQQGGDPSQEPGQPPGAGAAGPAQPDEEPDDNLLHQDGQTPPWAVQSDDEGDDQLISQQAKKSARDIARFATNELRKARVSRVVRGSEQTIEIRED